MFILIVDSVGIVTWGGLSGARALQGIEKKWGRAKHFGTHRVQERKRENGFRKRGAYGVLAGLFLGCCFTG